MPFIISNGDFLPLCSTSSVLLRMHPFEKSYFLFFFKLFFMPQTWGIHGASKSHASVAGPSVTSLLFLCFIVTLNILFPALESHLSYPESVLNLTLNTERTQGSGSLSSSFINFPVFVFAVIASCSWLLELCPHQNHR